MARGSPRLAASWNNVKAWDGRWARRAATASSKSWPAVSTATVTVVGCLAVPPLPVAVRVYVVVASARRVRPEGRNLGRRLRQLLRWRFRLDSRHLDGRPCRGVAPRAFGGEQVGGG